MQQQKQTTCIVANAMHVQYVLTVVADLSLLRGGRSEALSLFVRETANFFSLSSRALRLLGLGSSHTTFAQYGRPKQVQMSSCYNTKPERGWVNSPASFFNGNAGYLVLLQFSDQASSALGEVKQSSSRTKLMLDYTQTFGPFSYLHQQNHHY